MEKENTFTRREALQGLMGVTATAMFPAAGMTEQEPVDTATPWPAAMPAPNRLQTFNDNWRFIRGDDILKVREITVKRDESAR